MPVNLTPPTVSNRQTCTVTLTMTEMVTLILLQIAGQMLAIVEKRKIPISKSVFRSEPSSERARMSFSKTWRSALQRHMASAGSTKNGAESALPLKGRTEKPC